MVTTPEGKNGVKSRMIEEMKIHKSSEESTFSHGHFRGLIYTGKIYRIGHGPRCDLPLAQDLDRSAPLQREIPAKLAESRHSSIFEIHNYPSNGSNET